MRKSAYAALVFAFCLVFSVCLIGTAVAAEITEGGVYDLGNMGAPVTINTTEPVMLKGKLSGAIECVVEGVQLTLNGVTVPCSNGCALSFTGAGNTLTLEGKNLVKSGGGAPGIRVEAGAELTIAGDGSLTATGGEGAAGIGTGADAESGRHIAITGGTVIAIGGNDAAGIGGGKNTDSCDITIAGDALIYASRGETGSAFDIGAGDGASNSRSFTIKGKPAVFLGTGACVQPSANNHTYKTPDDKDYPMIAQGDANPAAIYGLDGTGGSPWTDAKGGYFMLYYLKYDHNGGQGGLSEAQRALHMTVAVTVAGGEELQRDKYLFTGWNMKAGGSGAAYMPGNTLTCSVIGWEITLYAQWKSAGDNDIYAGGDYNLSKMKSPVTINTTQPVTLTGSLRGSIECTVEGVNLTLRDVQATQNEGCALSFTGADNALTLQGKNTVMSGGRSPGIRVEKHTALTITGDGSLQVTGGQDGGAGIGGGDCEESGSLTIENGDITAVGGGNGAGIGGGSCRDGGDVTITGGTVTATGGDRGGAGIGGSSDNGYRSIVITGGTVIASGGAGGGCGLGQGWNSAKVINGGEIMITDGNITATGTRDACGIGGGGWNSGGVITIEGGTITANGGIGGGSLNDFQGDSKGLITISGGTIVADGGIGCWSDIVISGGDITAIGKDTGAGIEASIGGGSELDLKSITITGGTIVAIGGRGGAGIGGGSMKRMKTITITGGDITATGGDPFINTGAGWNNQRFGGGAGIGGGYSGAVDEIIISGGVIRATGGEEGAGIGRGTETNLRKITISGGIVEAYGGRYSAGIGGGKDRNSCDTIISGSSLVYAQRGEDAHYDIGAGEGGHNNEGRLYIRDSAAVFLGSNRSATPVAVNYIKKRPGNKTDPMILRMVDGEPRMYGIAGTGEPPWAEAKGGYFVLRTVHYDANGGDGALPDPGPVHIMEPVTAKGPDGLSKAGYTFTCWNTQANLRGRTYFPGDMLEFPDGETELTLYAQWDME